MAIQQTNGGDAWSKFLALVPSERLEFQALNVVNRDAEPPADSFQASGPVAEEAPRASTTTFALDPETVAYIENSKREAAAYVQANSQAVQQGRTALVNTRIQQYQIINGSMSNLMPPVDPNAMLNNGFPPGTVMPGTVMPNAGVVQPGVVPAAGFAPQGWIVR